MRVCPKCHYVDPPWWRPSRWLPEHDTARIEDLQLNEPIIAQELTEKEVAIVDVYVYWKSKRSPRVRRTWIEHWNMFGKAGEPQEKPKDPFQKKLDSGLVKAEEKP